MKNFTKSVDKNKKVLYTLSEVEERRVKMAREKLRKYRQSIGKTQEEMAEIWGITLSFYYKIESW